MEEPLTLDDALRTLSAMAIDHERWFHLAHDGERFLARDEATPDQVFVLHRWGMEPADHSLAWPVGTESWAISPTGDVLAIVH